MRKNVPNYANFTFENTKSNARNFRPIKLVHFGTWLYDWYVWYVLVRHCTFANNNKRGLLFLSIIVTELLWRAEVRNVPNGIFYSLNERYE